MGKAGFMKRAAWRGAFLTLAFLALLMKVAAPPGFMVSAQGPGGFPLVICTGHGPLTSNTPDNKGGDSRSKSDAPCAFAGHAAPPTPAVGAPVIAAAFVHTADPPSLKFDLAPGRGLAAPPPPSQGPPILL
jgi:hypothetical protein